MASHNDIINGQPLTTRKNTPSKNNIRNSFFASDICGAENLKVKYMQIQHFFFSSSKWEMKF